MVYIPKVLFALITIAKVNLLEECRRNCSKISGCCPFYEIHTFHGVSHPRPPILGGTWKKGKAEKICYFKGDPKFKAGGGAVTL